MTATLITAGVGLVLVVGALRLRALSRRLARLERHAVRRWERPRSTPSSVQQLAALGKPLSRRGG